MTRTRNVGLGVFLVVALTVPASAQISFGVTQQNGVVTGGSLNVGGFISADRRYVRLGVNAGSNQLIDVFRFNLLNGGTANNGNAGGNNGRNVAARPQPTVQQFVVAAGNFDRNADRALDKDELTLLANAVLTDLHRGGQLPAAWRFGNPHQKRLPDTTPSADEFRDAFVARSLTFDKDDSATLDEAETRRLAAVLLGTLRRFGS